MIVTPAPGLPGAVPFWKGDGVGRPRELGEAIGAFCRWAVDQDARGARGATTTSTRARPRNLVEFLREQQRRDARRAVATARSWSSASATRSATGGCACSRPFGGRVHAAWGLALSARIRDELGLEADAIWSDDGIIVHLPDAEELDRGCRPGRCSSPRRSRTWSSAELVRQRAVRRPLPRERRPARC